MIYEPCKWYKNIKYESPLDNFLRDRSIGEPPSYCEDDKQTFILNYIQCIKLDDIEKREPWSPVREEKIRKWATPENLRRLKYIQDEESGKRIITSDAFHDIPILSRKFDLKSIKQENFKITDGIHRINRARELGIDCIMASVEETVTVDKNDMDNIDKN